MRKLNDRKFRRHFIALVIAWIVASFIFGFFAWALFAIFTYAVPGLKLTGSLTPFVVIGMITAWQLIEVAQIDIDDD